MNSLTTRVVNSIEKLRISASAVNMKTAQRVLTICDTLHKGGKVHGYRQTDIPTDEKYEELKQLYESILLTKLATEEVTSRCYPKIAAADKELVIQMDIDNKLSMQAQRYQRKDTNKEAYVKNFQHTRKDSEPILIMDGIELPKEVPTIEKRTVIMPKFDGCTVAIAFDENDVLCAHTRGIDSTTGDRKINFVTEKMKYLFKPASAFENLRKNQIIKINVKDTELVGNDNTVWPVFILTENIKEIRIRAECVKQNKNSEETATGFVAGAINGKLETFRTKLFNLCLRPFEIGLIRTTEGDYIPSQESSLELLKMMELLFFEPLYEERIDKKFAFNELLDTLKERYSEPLDGLVYCSSGWTYPYITEESSKRVNYGKYKFKKNNVVQSRLLGITYSIGATGKYTPTLQYEPVTINDKKYHQAKMAVRRILDFGEIFVGQPADIELKADINPMVVTVYPPTDRSKKIELIKTCVHCGEVLEYKTNKQNDVVMTCINQSCIGVLRQRMVKFLSTIGYKGISEKTLVNNNITDINQVSFKNDIDKLISKLTIGDIYIGCSLCTAQSAKKIPNSNWTIRNWPMIRDQLLRDHGDDVFVYQVINFINSRLGV